MNVVHDVNTLAGLLGTVSRHYGSKTALIVDGGNVTFEELESSTNRVAGVLLQHGVEPNDRIAILGKDSLDSALVLFGAAKAKAVSVNVNWRLTPEEIAYIIDDARPKFFFVDGEFTPLLPRIGAASSLPKIVTLSGRAPGWPSLADSCKRAPDSAPGLDYDSEDIVVQIYTSGTTGHPKGVQLANRSFFAIAQKMAAQADPWIGWTDADVSLLFVPTFHIGGLWWLVRGLALGSTTVLLKGFEPATILRAIPQYGVTKVGMVPAMLQVLLGEPGCASTDFSTLKTLVYGGSPISPDLLQCGMETLKCDFCQIYGMTETGNMAVCLRPEDHNGVDSRRLRAAGRPLPGVEVRILDTHRKPVGAGTVGEIAIKTPARMIGYWNLPESTDKTMVDDWILTGDAGYIDDEGYIYVYDRIKDMIISAGENIYPAEIERVIRAHADVTDAAVIGVPDSLWGEAAKAIVVRSPGSRISAADVIRHTRTQLAEFKVPKSVQFMRQLPRNASGKILKSKLRQPYWQGRERNVN